MTAHSPSRSAAWVRRGALVGLGLFVSCAGKNQVQDIYSPGAAPMEASAEAEGAPMEELADAYAGDDMSAADSGGSRLPKDAEQLDLAAYERLLEQQELRLRSAGVAMRGDAMYAENGADEVALDSTGGIVGDVDSTSPSGGGSTATTKPSAQPTQPTKTSKKKKKKKSTNTKAGSTSTSRRDVPPSSPPSGLGKAAGAGSGEESDRCSTICELAASTCDLERQICDLALRHPDEERYAQVCARAADDCLLARNACQSCPV